MTSILVATNIAMLPVAVMAAGALGGYPWEWRQTTKRVTPAPA